MASLASPNCPLVRVVPTHQYPVRRVRTLWCTGSFKNELPSLSSAQRSTPNGTAGATHVADDRDKLTNHRLSRTISQNLPVWLPHACDVMMQQN
eukprot:5934502-Prymnesium_polylepis.1